jgi:hypothetical protein
VVDRKRIGFEEEDGEASHLQVGRNHLEKGPPRRPHPTSAAKRDGEHRELRFSPCQIKVVGTEGHRPYTEDHSKIALVVFVDTKSLQSA